MNTFWKIVKNQARQFHVSATEMLSVQWSFEKVLHEVVHGVLVARERPCTKAQGQHLVVRILVFAPHRSVLTTDGLTGGGRRAARSASCWNSTDNLLRQFLGGALIASARRIPSWQML